MWNGFSTLNRLPDRRRNCCKNNKKGEKFHEQEFHEARNSTYSEHCNDVQFETPTQGIGGDEDPEDIGVTDLEPSPSPESNPHTGLAFSAFAVVIGSEMRSI